MSENDRIVFGGVDTHRDTHVAAVVDATGRVLGHGIVSGPTPPVMNSWATGWGPGVEWPRSG